MTKRKLLIVFFIISLLPMLMNQYFTWHVMTITGEISLKNSIRYAFPEFYVGFVISVIMVTVYIIVWIFSRKGIKSI